MQFKTDRMERYITRIFGREGGIVLKKKLLPLAAATTLVLSLSAPDETLANTDSEIKELRQEVKEKQQKQKEIQEQIKENEKKQQSVRSELDRLEESLEETKEKIRQLNNEI